jgi:hypothetical protein
MPGRYHPIGVLKKTGVSADAVLDFAVKCLRISRIGPCTSGTPLVVVLLFRKDCVW